VDQYHQRKLGQAKRPQHARHSDRDGGMSQGREPGRWTSGSDHDHGDHDHGEGESGARAMAHETGEEDDRRGRRRRPAAYGAQAPAGSHGGVREGRGHTGQGRSRSAYRKANEEGAGDVRGRGRGSNERSGSGGGGYAKDWDGGVGLLQGAGEEVDVLSLNTSTDVLAQIGGSLGIDEEWASDSYESLMASQTEQSEEAAELSAEALYAGDERAETMRALRALKTDEERCAVLDEMAEEIREAVHDHSVAAGKEILSFAHEEIFEVREDFATLMEQLAEDTKGQLAHMHRLDSRRKVHNDKAASFFARVKDYHKQRDPQHPQRQEEASKLTACQVPNYQRDLVNQPHLYAVLDGEKGLARDHPNYEVVRDFVRGISLNRSWPEADKISMVQQMVRDLRDVDNEFGIGEIPLSSLEVPRRFTYQGNQDSM
jgi:hypothetical protein